MWNVKLQPTSVVYDWADVWFIDPHTESYRGNHTLDVIVDEINVSFLSYTQRQSRMVQGRLHT